MKKETNHIYTTHVKPAIKRIFLFQIRISPIKKEIRFGVGKSCFISLLINVMIINGVENAM